MEYKRILEVRDLSKIFGRGKSSTIAAESVTFDLLNGEFLGIMGASGSGKTTLLNLIATIMKPTKGQIIFEGSDIAKFSKKRLLNYRGMDISYIFQDYALLYNLTSLENIMMPLTIHNIKIDKDKIIALAKLFDIENILNKFPDDLSGGEKQRVAALRAIIINPKIILADEPTGALDTKNATILLNKLKLINDKYNKSIIMVTHDNNAASFCKRILFIKDGRIYNELRRKEDEGQREFFERINKSVTQIS